MDLKSFYSVKSKNNKKEPEEVLHSAKNISQEYDNEVWHRNLRPKD